MSYFVVDVESDGQIPGKYSMIKFGAVCIFTDGNGEIVFKKFASPFIKPISSLSDEGALNAIGIKRADYENGSDPMWVMESFSNWIKDTNKKGSRPMFISDNNGFDWSFINWYFHTYTRTNPFGWSSRRIGDLYCGFKNDTYATWKHLRKTRHTHDPVDDALGNAEALVAMKKEGLNIRFD